jgi:hypothetical protein
MQCIWSGIQNIPYWCRHLYSSCGSANHGSQQSKLWFPDRTATFCGDCVKTCEDVAPNFDENRPSCFTMTTLRLTLPSTPSSFCERLNGCHPPPTVLPWFGTLWLLPISKNEIEAERTPVWYHWGDPGRIAECLTLRQERTSRKRSKNGGDCGTGVCMRGGGLLRGCLIVSIIILQRQSGIFWIHHRIAVSTMALSR